MNYKNTIYNLISCISLLVLAGCSAVQSTQESRFLQKYKKYDYCQFNAVKQSQNNSCGSAAITAVLNYWGVDVNESTILEEYPKLSNQGYSILELKNIAEENNLVAYAFAMNKEPLIQLENEILKGRPVICAMNYPVMLYFAYDVPIYGPFYRSLIWLMGPRKNHYIVVFGIDSTNFLIMDPAYGFVEITREDFESCWISKSYAVLLCARK